MSVISKLTVEIAKHNKVRYVNCWNSQIHRKVRYAKYWNGQRQGKV